MSVLHNEVISFKELKRTLPIRYSYTDPQEREQVNKLLDEQKPILFLPTYLQERPMQDVKYEKAKYKIILSGIFTDGRRANVVIDGIKPYFEVRIPDPVKGVIKVGRGKRTEYITKDVYISRLRELLARDDLTKPEKTFKSKGKPFKYYQKNQSTFIKFYYLKTKSRKLAIKLVIDAGYETAHDDLSCYYRVVCRDNLTSMAMWVVLDNYAEENVDNIKSKDNISTYRLHIRDYKAYDGELTPKLLKDKTLSMTWDIETWSPEGDVPLPEYGDHRMFCIGTTFQWVNEDKPFLRIALVDYPSNASSVDQQHVADVAAAKLKIKNLIKEKADATKISKARAQLKDLEEHPPGFLTVVCGNEVNVIKAFGIVFEKMRPEFIIGFNDSDYDWNWLIKRACETRGLVSKLAGNLDCMIPWKSYTDETVMKFNYKREKVKVEATMYAEGYTLMMNGYIPIDVRTVFRKLYPTAESSSLKWFLAKNKLGGKEDMPYQVMFKIYGAMNKIRNDERVTFKAGVDTEFTFADGSEELIAEYEGLKQKLYEVNNYCVVDALRCHELCKIRSVLMDHREVSNVAYTSVYDAFYRANGMKVRNLTIAIGQDKALPFGIKFTNITSQVTDEGKYPGAYVFPPKKGLQTSKLTIPERIKKADMTKDSKRKSMQEWLNTDDEEVQKFYDIVKEYGATVTEPDKIAEIEEKYSKLPKKFLDFMAEHMGRPITGLDFASLYPSLIRCYNYSPEYCIKDKHFAKQIHASGQKLNKVDFDFSGSRRKAWFVWHNNKMDPAEEGFQFGVYPYILDILFKKRKLIKKQMKVFAHQKEQMETESAEWLKEHAEEYENICFNYNYLNSKQLALKVFMNTFYGEAGNKLSPFFVVEVAGGITMAGQKNIKMSQAFVEEQGHNVYYGDSVAEYTPVWVRRNGEITYGEFRDLASSEMYEQYNDGKEIAILENHEIWSDAGWTKVKHIIRHKTDKQMYRVSTHTSIIDVTEDHSLLDDKGKEITPGSVSVGDKLMCKQSDNIVGATDLIDPELAWVVGLFVADGSCDSYDCTHGWKYSWVINNQDLDLLHKSKDVLERYYPGYEFKILDTFDSSAVYKLVPTNKIKGKIRDFVELWREMCYYDKSKIVPSEVYNSTLVVQKSFFKGYYWGDSDKSSNNNKYDTDFDNISKRFDIKTQISASSFQVLCRNLGYNVSVNFRGDKLDIYRLTITTNAQRKKPNVIKKIMKLPKTTAYVYDIETGNHHFAAGIGDLIVHNTDSIYLACAHKHFKEADRLYYSGQMTKLEYWTALVDITFEVIKPLNDEVNEMFFQDNKTRFLSMAYEEALFPVAFTAKKKYFGIPHENIANFNPKHLFIRGLEVKKRGVSDLLKKIFNELMWTACVDRDNLYTLLELSLTKIDDIYQNRQWNLDDFVQSAVYRPNKNNVSVQKFVARMADRGITVPSNERFGYVIVKRYPYSYDHRGRKSNLSIGDKMEYVQTVNDENLTVDLDHYMKGSVNGQLARLVVYHEMFHVDPMDDSPDELKVAEDHMFKHAGKFIGEYAGQYYSEYNTFGSAYQKVFRTANKLVGDHIKSHDKLTHQLVTANVPDSGFEEWFIEGIDKKAVKLASTYGPEFIAGELAKISGPRRKGEEKRTKEEKAVIKKKQDDKVKMMQQVYYGAKKSIMNLRAKSFRETMSLLRRRVREHIAEFRRVYSRYQGSVNGISEVLKNQLTINNDLFDATSSGAKYKLEDLGELDKDLLEELKSQAEDEVDEILGDAELQSIIAKMKKLYKDILSAHLVYRRTQSIVDALKIRRDRMTRSVMRPDEGFMETAIAADIQDAMDNICDIGDLGIF